MGPGSVTLDGGGSSEAALKSQPLGDFKVLHFAAHGVSSESETRPGGTPAATGPRYRGWPLAGTRDSAHTVERGCGRAFGVRDRQRSTSRAGRCHESGAVIPNRRREERRCEPLSVDDRSTATLMESFYAHLGAGLHRGRRFAPGSARLHQDLWRQSKAIPMGWLRGNRRWHEKTQNRDQHF